MHYQHMKGLAKTGGRVTVLLLIRLMLIIIITSIETTSVHADGGVVLWQRTTGSFTTTVFATEAPLPAGPADLSVLVESAGEPHPIMDAQVFIELRNEAGTTVSGEATHKQARNKLLYCSLLTLPEPGKWKMMVIINHDSQRSEVFDHLMVIDPRPKLFSYWKLMAFPPAVIIFFIINQWLRRRNSAFIN